MSIGNNTTWIIVVSTPDGFEAVTDPHDKRRALHFATEKTALFYLNNQYVAQDELANPIIVKVRG